MDTEKTKYNKVKKAPKESIDILKEESTTPAETVTTDELVFVTAEVIKCSNLNFRSAPSITASVLCVIPGGSKIKVLEPSNAAGKEFIKARCNGQEGYVKTEFIKVVPVV